MRNWPTDPLRQHDRLIAAICDDFLETGTLSLDGSRTLVVAEINRQVSRANAFGTVAGAPSGLSPSVSGKAAHRLSQVSTRDGECANNGSPTDND